MQVKVPGFDIKLKTIWVIVGVVWHLLYGAALWYGGQKISQYQIEHKIEQTTGQVGGLTTTFQERIKVTDGRFEKLETGQVEIDKKVSAMQGDVKGISKQMDNMVLLMSSLLKDKVAQNPVPTVHSAVYEVQN